MRHFLLILLMLTGMGWALPTEGTNKWTSASAGYSDVKEAYDSCDGVDDTLYIAADTSVWEDSLYISKAIVLIGEDTGGVLIKTDKNADFAFGAALVRIVLVSDISVRITGISFQSDATVDATSISLMNVEGSSTGIYNLTGIRIDNCKFVRGSRTLKIIGRFSGVIDHNLFINNKTSVYLQGDNSASWNRSIIAGTSNATFIEDNKFSFDENYIGSTQENIIYHQSGSISVSRYNTIDCTWPGWHMQYDSHGNFGGASNTWFTRGQPLIEMYCNNWSAYSCSRFPGIRGGSCIIFNNDFTMTDGVLSELVQFTEEEAWTSGGPWCPDDCPIKSTWPAYDQVNNTFVWGNTYNGSIDSSIGWSQIAVDTVFFHKNRDYYLHKPEFIGGQEYWTTVPGDTTMYFDADSSNKYWPYFAYTYPHPLTGASKSFIVTSHKLTSGHMSSVDTIVGIDFKDTGEIYVGSYDSVASVIHWVNDTIIYNLPNFNTAGVRKIWVINDDRQVDSSLTFEYIEAKKETKFTIIRYAN